MLKRRRCIRAGAEVILLILLLLLLKRRWGERVATIPTHDEIIIIIFTSAVPSVACTYMCKYTMCTYAILIYYDRTWVGTAVCTVRR